MNIWYFQFKNDNRGYGTLVLNEGNLIAMIYDVRTGAINIDGKLKNAIYDGVWSIREKCEITHEIGMVVDIELPAFKSRLWTPRGNRSRYLMHADGNKPGSRGCIVTDQKYGNANPLFRSIDKILEKQDTIPVYVNIDVPLEVKNGKDVEMA